ncbi:MAG TPA: cytochrome c [Methylomirabilota bacterium]|nr:cytochrome c [Methylomirabilota bacterium]
MHSRTCILESCASGLQPVINDEGLQTARLRKKIVIVSQHSITGRAPKLLRALNLSNPSAAAIRIAVLLLILLPTLPAWLRFPKIHAYPDKPPPPTFYRDVLPILQNHCQVCHRTGEIGPMPLFTYAQTQPLARAIATDAGEKKMPPWFADPSIGHFSSDPSLTNQEIATLVSWADSNAPAGNASDAPSPRQWTLGWLIPHPDTVLKMPKSVAIPAHGDVDYTYEIVPTHFTEDKWVQFSEIRPSSRENVHHAVVYVRPPNSNWLQHAPIGVPFTGADMPGGQDRNDTHFTTADILLVYAPGSSPDNWPEGAAKFIPAGSDLVFQMHYMTHGHAATDQTSVGLVFARQAPTQRILTLQLTNDHFVIPPGAPDFRVEIHGSLPNDAVLLSFFPHMHLRGKRFEYNILHPGGAPETLLRVNYDFYWQLSYRLLHPLPLNAGTVLQAVAWYDNSKNNPHNPDPDLAVRWGDQTYDEMMVGFFDVAVPANMDKTRYFLRPAAP